MRYLAYNAATKARQIVTSPIERGFASRPQVPSIMGGKIAPNAVAISVVDENSNAAWLQTRFIASQIATQNMFLLLPALERAQDIYEKPFKLVNSGAKFQHLKGRRETGLVGMHACQGFLQVSDGTKKQDILSFMMGLFGYKFLTEMPAAFEATKTVLHYNAMIGFGSQAQNLNEYKVEKEIRADMIPILDFGNIAIQGKRTTKGTTINDLAHGAEKIFAPKHQLEVCGDLLQSGTSWLNTRPIINSYTDSDGSLVTINSTEFFEHNGAILMRQEYKAIDQMKPNLLLPYVSNSNAMSSRIISEVDKATKKRDQSKSLSGKSNPKE